MNTIDQRTRNVAIAVTLIGVTPQAAQSDEYTDADLARMNADRPDPDRSWSGNIHRKHVATAQLLLAGLFSVVVAQFHCFLAVHRGRNTRPGRRHAHLQCLDSQPFDYYLQLITLDSQFLGNIFNEFVFHKHPSLD